MNMLIVLLLLLCATPAVATTYVVATTGSDTNPGTLDLPFATITRGVQAAAAGDTIFVRGGTYSLTTTITISKIGTDSARYHLYAWPGERPLLDFTGQAFGQRGVRLSGRYWHVRGLDIRKAGDNGMHVSGSWNIIEFCSFSENQDTGLQLSNGAAWNSVINCDSYFNADPDNGDADGFAAKLDVGTGNAFSGCRAWQNSDDGYDGYLRPSDDITTTMENCWIFRNGYLMDGSPSVGNGNGFKMGGSDSPSLLRHNLVLTNCVAFDNRVKGFDQNNNKGSMTLYNCTAFRNGTNYSLNGAIAAGKTATIVNGVVLGSPGPIAAFVVQQTNSWLPPFTVTTADFQSIDTAGVRGPRQADGSLPLLPFLRLAQGSDLIDAGTDVGLPFLGGGPDLGAFEYDGPSDAADPGQLASAVRLHQNYPNPFNPSTTVVFDLGSGGPVTLEAFDLLGRPVAALVQETLPAGAHTVRWDATGLPSGTYVLRLRTDAGTSGRTALLLR
jgi:hypothetical protein